MAPKAPAYEPAGCCLAVEIAGVSVRVDDVPWEDRLRMIAELVALKLAAFQAIPDLRPTLDVVPGSTCATHVGYDDEGGIRRKGPMGF